MSGAGDGSGSDDADDNSGGDGANSGGAGEANSGEAGEANNGEAGEANGDGTGGVNGGETGRVNGGGASGVNGGVGRLSQYFDALADERRRFVLYYLHQHGAASVSELACYATGCETGRAPGSLSTDEYAPAASELHHKHLPRLADYGLVEFDPRSEQVRFREPTRTFSTLLWLSRLVEGEGQQ